MLIHVLKLFIRNFRKNLLVNLLNLVGLAAGLAACMMIIVYLHHEYSYDDFHEYGDRIVRINTFQKVGEGQEIRVPSASYHVAEGLAAEIGAVEEFVRFRFSRRERPVYVDERIFYEADFIWADSTLFDVFSYRLLRGDPRTALDAKGSVVLADRPPARIALRLKEGGVNEAIDHVRKLWEEGHPRAPFRYMFLDETFDRIYEREVRTGRLLAFYTTLAIVISCVGLLALTAFSAERRLLEISIRKVLGATPANLFALLSGEYLWVVVASMAVAAPLAWWAMRSWLENFAYRSPFAWWLYPAAGAAALVLALLTASAYTWRACRVNPAETLRQE